MRRKPTYRQRTDRAHETRMWIKDVIIPVIMACVLINRWDPGLKFKIQDWWTEQKRKFNDKFHGGI